MPVYWVTVETPETELSSLACSSKVKMSVAAEAKDTELIPLRIKLRGIDGGRNSGIRATVEVILLAMVPISYAMVPFLKFYI